MRRKFFLHTIWFLLLAARLPAQNAYTFTPALNNPFQLLDKHLQLLEDKKGEFSINEVLQKESSFKPASAYKKPDAKSTWWVRLNMLPSFSSDSFYIGLPPEEIQGLDQGNDKVDVWMMHDSSITAHYETGTMTPISRRPIATPVNRNVFPVQLKANEPLTVYLRIQRTHYFATPQLNFVLQHAALINPVLSALDKTAWFYTGLMCILFIFGLVFFIITREKPFIWFACIAALLCLHIQLLNTESNFTKWLFPERPTLQFPLFILLTNLFGILIFQFIRSFVHLKKILPLWDKIIKGIMAYMLLMLLLRILLFEINPAIEVPRPLFMVIFLSGVITGTRLMLTKNLYVSWAGFALLWLFFFQVMGIFWNIGLLPGWVPNPWVTAQAGMMIIIFFALAFRFKQSAKEKAEAAKVLELDAIKSRFFANISHEFRTPLTLMLGPLKQLEENTLDENQQKKYLKLMRRNGNRLLQLIHQLLDLSKLESGKMELKVCKTDITGLLKTIASSFDGLAEQNQVNYHVHLSEENIIGFTDRDKLEKIVVNLLSNAFRFTAANGTVSFLMEQDGKRLRFTVQDDGAGIPKAQLDKIFDRFQQVAGTTGGTGIGLALVKDLLQLHKGQISVQSEMGKGSSFRASIPIAEEFYTAAEIVSSSANATATIFDDHEIISAIDDEENYTADTSLPLVLIAEDNIELQQFISDTLQNSFQVKVAANGKIALQKAIEEVPDCIISDIIMPEMDGIELCNHLKKEPATSHIPVILLTAKADRQTKMEGLQSGAD
ncbi:MAG: ATP-binding protein, partial [Ferruginibacter sp.]